MATARKIRGPYNKQKKQKLSVLNAATEQDDIATVAPVEAGTATVASIEGITATVTPVEGGTATVTPVEGGTATVTPVTGAVAPDDSIAELLQNNNTDREEVEYDETAECRGMEIDFNSNSHLDSSNETVELCEDMIAEGSVHEEMIEQAEVLHKSDAIPIILNERSQFIFPSLCTEDQPDATTGNEEGFSEEHTDYADDDDDAHVLPEIIAQVVEDQVPEVNATFQKEKHDHLTLYAGTSKKLGLVLLMICILSIRFKLSDEALNYIITIISMLLPPGNNMIKSVYALKEYLKRFVNFPKIHYLCSNCGTHVEQGSKTCSNQYCLRNLTEPGAVGYFIQHSVINQLQLMCKRSTFLEKIRSNRFKHYKNNQDKNICDCYDGTNYRTAYENGFLNDPNSISFSLNTDGVQIFKSSVVSMWPVYMIINELPTTDRKLKENVVYYGLWISSKKPMMWSYLKPLYDEMCKLEDGVMMEDNNGKDFRMRATILNCVCDLPARCMMSNSMQFNGKYGCWFCLQPGETYSTKKGGHVHVFPFQSNDPKGPARNPENLEHDLNAVVKNVQENRKNFISRGIKGPFWFMFLKHFHVVNGFVIDYMHGICAGVMKQLMVLWFDKIHKNEPFSVYAFKARVSDRLKQIKPNLSITRPPRSLDEMAHWKTSEFRNFLFLWSLPVLFDVLPAAYYVHFCLLVKAIFTLSKEAITRRDIENAERCLFKFVENFDALYSLRYMTMNCHQLLHITDCVVANGPLFANNCFFFEDLNGYILKHIHGPTGVEMQIINALTKMQAIPSLIEVYVEKNSADEVFINGLLRPNYIHDGTVLENGIFLLGQTYSKELSDAEFIALSGSVNGLSPSVTEFRRIFVIKFGCPIYGTSYQRLNKRNQSIVKYLDKNRAQFGVVNTFVQVETLHNAVSNFALTHPAMPAEGEHFSQQKSCHKVRIKYTEIKCIPLTDLLGVCCLVDLGHVTYISEFPNCYEKD